MLKKIIIGATAIVATEAVNLKSQADTEWDRTLFGDLFLKDGADSSCLTDQKPEEIESTGFLYNWRLRDGQ